jgi:hypothetical protein
MLSALLICTFVSESSVSSRMLCKSTTQYENVSGDDEYFWSRDVNGNDLQLQECSLKKTTTSLTILDDVLYVGAL